MHTPPMMTYDCSMPVGKTSVFLGSSRLPAISDWSSSTPTKVSSLGELMRQLVDEQPEQLAASTAGSLPRLKGHPPPENSGQALLCELKGQPFLSFASSRADGLVKICYPLRVPPSSLVSTHLSSSDCSTSALFASCGSVLFVLHIYSLSCSIYTLCPPLLSRDLAR